MTSVEYMIRVFLVDDHEAVRRGVAALLETEDDIEVIGEAGTAESAIERIPALRPDVAVLDIRLPDGSGVAVRTVASGQSLLDPHSTAAMLHRLREQADRKDPLGALSEQERQVLDLIGEGVTNRSVRRSRQRATTAARRASLSASPCTYSAEVAARSPPHSDRGEDRIQAAAHFV